jgi:hypothetical protein
MNVTRQHDGNTYQIVKVYVGGKPRRAKWPILRAWRELIIWFFAGIVVQAQAGPLFFVAPTDSRTRSGPTVARIFCQWPAVQGISHESTVC